MFGKFRTGGRPDADDRAADGAQEASEKEGRRCADCKMLSPETQTNYTLISSRHGWRLSQSVAEDGRRIIEWRCPACWQRYRSTTR